MCDHIQKLRRTSGDGGVITDRYADTFSCGSLQMESSKDRRVKIREGKEYFARWDEKICKNHEKLYLTFEMTGL